MRDLARLLLLAVLAVFVSACFPPVGGPDGEGGPNDDGHSANIGAMVPVPAGSFQRDAEPANISQITSAFWMSTHEITRRQFEAVLGGDPSIPLRSTSSDDPVQMANWYHAIAFCNRLSLLEGLTPVYAVDGVDFAALAFADIPVPGSPLSDPVWDAVTARSPLSRWGGNSRMSWVFTT